MHDVAAGTGVDVVSGYRHSMEWDSGLVYVAFRSQGEPGCGARAFKATCIDSSKSKISSYSVIVFRCRATSAEYASE